jgi:DMSO/TMAO reductase YedYZ molybdopterin-dependent catalytic subunit
MLAGLLAGATGVTVGFLVAGFTGLIGSPVVAVAEMMIDLSPPAVKNFAISEFGPDDKLALQIGVVVVLGLFCAVIGILAQRSIGRGLVGLGVFAVVGTIAAATRPTAGPVDVLPTLVGSGAAALTLVLLTRAAKPPAEQQRIVAPSRRQFVSWSATAAGAAAVAYLGGRLLSEGESVQAAISSMKLPAATRPVPPLPDGCNLRIPGLGPFITPNGQFYRVDTAIVIPQIPPSSWQLRIHGMVDRPLTLSFDDLIRQPLIEDYLTLTCVSNPVGGPYISTAKFLGTPLGALLRKAGIQAGADQLFCTSFDGFTSGTPVQTAMDGRDAMLAIGMNGKPLPTAHGFPVRTVVPGLYGYVSACKWIVDIEVTTYAKNAAYWAQRGWSEQAPIKTESRIDVPSGASAISQGPTKIAGVAWAQHKGIDAVHVRVDRGPWRQATLAAVPGIDTWRQWVISWDATPGTHLIEARATDATGYTQTSLIEPPEPNGASGYPQLSVQVTA